MEAEAVEREEDREYEIAEELYKKILALQPERVREVVH